MKDEHFGLWSQVTVCMWCPTGDILVDNADLFWFSALCSTTFYWYLCTLVDFNAGTPSGTTTIQTMFDFCPHVLKHVVGRKPEVCVMNRCPYINFCFGVHAYIDQLTQRCSVFLETSVVTHLL